MMNKDSLSKIEKLIESLFFNYYLLKKKMIKNKNKTIKIFFITYAFLCPKNSTPEFLRNLAKSDSHSPNYFRVNGVLQNVDAFHKIFETIPGDGMYKAPEDRIKIW